MNDHGSHWPPAVDDDPERRSARSSMQRAFMDRARRAVEHEAQQEPGPRRRVPHAIALVAAVAVALGTVCVFAAFLGGMQQVMRLLDEDAARQQQEEAERKKQEPMPAYVVPAD
jgi:cytochrome c-type biogenesis protein CcmH/NrfG